MNWIPITSTFLICLILLIDGIHSIKHRKDPVWSTPEECARTCADYETPRICYYHFTLENYITMGAACESCRPNATNVMSPNCQCVLADGVERGILTANRMIPGPSIQVCEGDKVVIDVDNQIEGMEVTLHWHGIWQRGSQYYDGVPFLTQCPIHQGNTFRYQWIAGNAGTHFWHSHTGLQKMDGLHGSLVVRQPSNRDPNSHLYDFDLTTHVIVLSDWFHENSFEHFPGRLRTITGQDPENVLINGKGQFRDPNIDFTTNTPFEVFKIKPNRRYRFRMINSFASICPAQLIIQGHNLTVIATDGEPVRPVVVDSIVSFSAERYDFVIKANRRPGTYWIQVKALGECGRRQVQQLAVLHYESARFQLPSPPPTYDSALPSGVVLNPPDGRCNVPRSDAICVNQLNRAKKIEDEDLLQRRPNIKIFLPFRFHVYRLEDLFTPNTYNRFLVVRNGNHVVSLVDGITYMSPPAPLLSQYDEVDPNVFCNGRNRKNCKPNCMCTHKINMPLNAAVEIILYDESVNSTINHPFHLHGYAFSVMGMGRSFDKNMTGLNLKHMMDLDRLGLLHRRHSAPPRKDTIAIPGSGYVVLRFRASNPGFWLLHCHYLFHLATGMDVVLHVGTQNDLPPVPAGFPRCDNFIAPVDTNFTLGPYY